MTGPASCAEPSNVTLALAALSAGRMILIVSEIGGVSRGDLTVAARTVQPAVVNAMTTMGHGLLQVAMRSDALDGLGIPPADPTSTGPDRDRFRVSVRLAGSAATGGGASVRAKTIRALVDPVSVPADFGRPGHVFPVGCATGGVLSNPAAPEAAVDLAELAGLGPSGVLCEVCGGDGEPASLPDLLEFSRELDLPVVHVDDVIAHRRRELCRVRRRGVARIPLSMGEFRAIGFSDGLDREHIAFVYGDPEARTKEAPLIRLHFECLLGDVLGSHRCGCRTRLDDALHQIAQVGCGALIYVRARNTTVRDMLRSAMSDDGTSDGLSHAVDEGDLQSALDILEELAMPEIQLLVDPGDIPVVPEHVRVAQTIRLRDDLISRTTSKSHERSVSIP